MQKGAAANVGSANRSGETEVTNVGPAFRPGVGAGEAQAPVGAPGLEYTRFFTKEGHRPVRRDRMGRPVRRHW